MQILQDVKDAVSDCIDFASSHYHHKSIGFPVLGTDGLDYPAEKVIEWVVDALADFQSSAKESSIKTVFICVDPKDDSPHIKQVCTCMTNLQHSSV
mgnify:CR=1 FL=1